MKVIISPSKTLKKGNQRKKHLPVFLIESKKILDEMLNLDSKSLASYLNVSISLAEKAYTYYKNINYELAAISYYDGIQFKALNFEKIPENNLKNLYILSGLYGILNAYDGITPYRYDKIDVKFWKERINLFLSKTFKDELIINLASKEYSVLLDLEKPNIVTIDFKEISEKNTRMSSTSLKRIRGLFANHILVNNLKTINELKDVVLEDFSFEKNHPKTNTLLFTRRIRT